MKNVVFIIVTYNRKKLLLDNINWILNQKKISNYSIIIVDNHGSDNTYDYLKESLSDLSMIDYHYLDNNIGGAGGFEFGLRTAYKQGFDWFVLMDDDGHAYDDMCFYNLFRRADEYDFKDLIFFNSLVCNDEENLSFGLEHVDKISQLENSKILNPDNTIDGLANPFNGTLVSRGLIEKIGYPHGDFFIKGDEVNFLNRAIKNGAHVKTIYDSRYYHPMVKNRVKRKVFGHEMYVYIEAPWKEFYNVRNYVYSTLENEGNTKDALRKTKIYKYKRIYCAIMLKCKKIETIKLIRQGFKDGKSGKLGIVYRP